jgi:hypothetical protein
MKYAVEMGSGATIYIPSFIKIGSSIPKLIGGIHRHTDRINVGANILRIIPHIRMSLTALPWKRNRLLLGQQFLVADYTS